MSVSQTPHTFGASTTAAEVIDGVDLHGRRAVVTGASSGIGVETVRALASAGADVTLAVRDTDAGAKVAARLESELPHGAGKLTVGRLDLADRSTIAEFVAAWQGPLHILVNNAGVMAPPQLVRTPDGRELQFAVNHLGHFAFAVGLHPALAAADGARVVAVSSIGHLFSPVVFDDLDYRYRPYDPWTSYGQSKTANVLFTVGAAERWADDGITANALMPGNIADTSLARHMDMQQVADFIASGELALPPGKTVEQGAATSVLLAASPTVQGITGRYFEDCAQSDQVTERATAVAGVAPYALNRENAARLWVVSEDLVR
ncbi:MULTISPECIES: SDR family NAD(P)-dependent oxidoreductase [unclassified Streptomyces]|uniref:SDR family NAD(P)-dependent oxidoreductase n=1 Tax=unclassified Streptomyces TaxID=2593676 RepID=UPI002E37DD2A|nr:SDR family NAD(P)-dependent oxidoreductase [Streptomyces sp. NBC_01280]WSE12622.1 SDR family NAD(P)-dependent oxidoreductase [Streptomyces sp. NBC_01397]